VVLDHFPKARCVGVGGDTFKHNFSTAQSQGTVGDVGVTCDPANVGRAPEHVVLFQVEGPLGGEGCVQQIATGGMLNTLRFTC